jgi:hypothetical protein
MITRCDSFCVEGRARRVPATYQGALRRRLGCCRVRLEAMPGSRGSAGRTAARIASAAADQQIHSVEDSLYPKVERLVRGAGAIGQRYGQRREAVLVSGDHCAERGVQCLLWSASPSTTQQNSQLLRLQELLFIPTGCSFPRRPASQRHTGSLGGSEIRPLTLAHDAFNGIGGSDGSQRITTPSSVPSASSLGRELAIPMGWPSQRSRQHSGVPQVDGPAVLGHAASVRSATRMRPAALRVGHNPMLELVGTGHTNP